MRATVPYSKENDVARLLSQEQVLAAIVGSEHVLRGPHLPSIYTQDLWGSNRPGAANLVVRPGSAEEVANILRHCHVNEQCVVVQGGMTGLVSGGVPGAGELVISTERLTQLGEVDVAAQTVTCGSGVTLAALQEHVGRHGLIVPIDIAPKASATIGGCVATNAGGLNVVGYGMTRDNVRSLQVALAGGRLLKLSTSLVKDNAGYDLKQLFIGSEGTLGVVTATTLALRATPPRKVAVFCAVSSVSGALDVLIRLRKSGSWNVTAFETIWNEAYQVLEGTGVQMPLPRGYPFYVLFECEIPQDVSAQSIVSFLDSVDDIVLSSNVAASTDQIQAFWQARKRIPVEILKMQPLFGFDVSLPGGQVDKCLCGVEEELRRIWPEVKLLVFGHLGDDNLHIAVITGEVTRKRKAEVDRIVYEAISKCGGSISAEHGIGFEKREYLGYTRSRGEIELMHTLKHALDPKGILNRGRVLPWNGARAND